VIIEQLVPSSPRTVGAHRVRIGDVAFGDDRIPIIAGPCAVEPDYIEHAQVAAAAGASALRGCVFKPRTHPASFQGAGMKGLELLDEARRLTGLPVLAEPLEVADVERLRPHVDALLIGTRSMHNTPLLRAAGRTALPVVVKRGMSATYDEWLAAAEYVAESGNDQIILCERGIRTFETATRNTLDVSAIAVLREKTDLPIIVDPSHATGRGAWVAPLALAAVAAGADGLLIECHPSPQHALCDGAQAITPAELTALTRAVQMLSASVRPSLPRSVDDARHSLDAIDSAIAGLIDRRARVVDALTRVKQELGVPLRDRGREQDVISRVQQRAPSLHPDAAALVMRAVIEACLTSSSAFQASDDVDLMVARVR